MKKTSEYGGAPKRSRLQERGYTQLYMKGCGVFTERQAKGYVEHLHDKGYLAQALHIRDYDTGDQWWIVMSKKGKRYD